MVAPGRRFTPAGRAQNRTPKLNYMVQETDNPIPAFKIFGGHSRFVHWSYRRYLETQLRRAYGYEGTPVQLWFIESTLPTNTASAPLKKKSKANTVAVRHHQDLWVAIQSR